MVLSPSSSGQPAGARRAFPHWVSLPHLPPVPRCAWRSGIGGAIRPGKAIQLIAVLTGDIVNSSALSADELDGVFASLGEAAAALAELQPIAPRLTRSRGDGWQAVVHPSAALLALALMRAAVRRTGKGRDTRIALAVGGADRLPDTLDAASGPAFLSSGRGLERLHGKPRMAATGAEKAAVALLDGLVSRWTPAQAAVVFELLAHPGRTQAEIASALGATQQNIQKQAEAARLWALQAAVGGDDGCE